MQTIYYWPDGTWCTEEQYNIGGYGWKSDDFGILEINENASDGEIDANIYDVISTAW